MIDLDKTLGLLARDLSWPASPDLTTRVAARLEQAPQIPRRRRLVPVVVMVLVLVMAIPGSRNQVLAFLGLRGLVVEQGQVNITNEITDLGSAITTAEAESRLGRSVSNSLLGEAAATYLDEEQRIWLVFSPAELTPTGALMTIFDAARTPAIIKRLSDPQFEAVMVEVEGEPAIWMTGEDHGVVFESRGGHDSISGRLSDNALVWQSGQLTYRLEADIDLETALLIAESMN